MSRGRFSATAFSPTGFSLAGPSNGRYANMLAQLLPPGRLWRLIPGASILYSLLEASADELDRVHERSEDLITESDPQTATELLPDYEQELALETASSIAERRARVVSRQVARSGYRPADFQSALAPLLGQAVVDVVVIERSRAFAIAIGDAREIFRFFIYRDPTAPGDYFLASAQEQLDLMKPSHTLGYVIESIDFLCDDPFSLCDRDLLGA